MSINPITPTGESVDVDAQIVQHHTHNEEKWVPATLSAPFPISTGALANAFGLWVQIIASTTALWTDFHRIIVSSVGIASVYEIEIGIGLAGFEVPITRMRFISPTLFAIEPIAPLQLFCPRIPINTRISVRVRCAVAGPQTLQTHYGYHEYSQ